MGRRLALTGLADLSLIFCEKILGRLDFITVMPVEDVQLITFLLFSMKKKILCVF